MKQKSTYVGIDLAKTSIDVAVRPEGGAWRMPHDEAGIEELVS